MKHIEIDCNYIRGKIQEGVVLNWHVNSSSTVSEPVYKGIWNATTLCFARTAWSEGHLLCEVFFPLNGVSLRGIFVRIKLRHHLSLLVIMLLVYSIFCS